MHTAILISIQSKWCKQIAHGRKTMLLYKNKPKINTPFKCYVYCKQGADILVLSRYSNKDTFLWAKTDVDKYNIDMVRNGKVLGEFVCDYIIGHCEMANADIAEQQSCEKREDILEYSNGKEVFGWHISDFVIWDTPRDISDFEKPCKCTTEYEGEICSDCNNCDCAGDSDYGFVCDRTLEKSPQTWCYVEECTE